MTKLKKTAFQGVYQLGRGRFKLKATANHPITGVRVARERVVEGLSIKQAVRAQESLRHQLVLELEGLTPPPGSPITVADWAEQWLEDKAGEVRSGVAKRYANTMAWRILPILGEIPMADLKRHHVKAWVAEIESMRTPSGEPFAKETLLGWWRVARCFLRDAAADVGIADPLRRISPPSSSRVKVNERRVLTRVTLRDLLEAVRKYAPLWYAEVYTMAFSGMRPSELYALTWAEIDFANGIIHVKWSFSDNEVNRTKTDDPREAAMTERMRGLLLHQKQRLASKPRLRRSVLVFPNSKGTHRYASSLYDLLNRMARQAGIDVRVGPKTLRKTFVTRAAMDGHDRLAIRANVGHSDEAMTERYAEVDIEAKRKMVEVLEAAAQG